MARPVQPGAPLTPSPQQPVGGHEDQQDEEKVSAHGHDYPTLAENRVGTAPR